MGPATTRKLQERRNRPSLPRARSPIKTNLQSPARHNPHLGPASSPTRGSIYDAAANSSPRPVKRRLDFSKTDKLQIKPLSNGHPKLNGSRFPNGNLANGRASHSEEPDSDNESLPPTKPGHSAEEEDEDDSNQESMQVLDMDGDDVDLPETDKAEPEAEEDDNENEQVEEQEVENEVKAQPAKRRGRKQKQPPAKVAQIGAAVTDRTDEEPAKKKRGRPAKNSPKQVSRGSSSSPKRRRSGRNSLDNDEEEPVEERGLKRQRTEKASNKTTAAAPNTKPAPQKGKPGRKRKSSGVGVDSPVVQRGPPLPKARGLVSLRREGTDGIRTTRSGRLSVKPLEFWKGEHYEFDNESEEVFGDQRHHFVFNKVKGIVRAEDPEPQPKSKKGRGRPPSGRPRGRRSSGVEEDPDPDEEPEEWEYDPGRVVGECFYWYPEYQEHPPEDEEQVQVAEEELAISSAAIQLRDIKDATFRFAKTLTLPFFGAGVVDLPPGSEKHPKNARKMQMVFFVHTGSVTVTIADVNTFRITKGGMWFVPRGQLPLPSLS